MNLIKKLNEVKDCYESTEDSGYNESWYMNGIRRVADVIIVDEDFELESFFLDRMRRVQKATRIEGREIHTRISSMSLYNKVTREVVDYDYIQLVDLRAKEMGDYE